MKWKSYIPIIVIVTFTLLAAIAANSVSGFPIKAIMLDWMGFFLVVFSMFKFFDLKGFSHGFAMYDLLAKRAHGYGLIYPFLELALGLGYLAKWNLPFVYVATVILMSFGAAGILVALKRGLNVNCACLGTTLKVPLSTVALTEDLVMAVMALVMLIWY